MIRLQDLTPEVYYKQSRDFQFIGRLYDIVLNYIKTNADNLYYLPIGQNMNEQLLNLLALSLGFKPKNNYNSKQLLAICSVLPEIMKNKGSLQSMITAVNALLAAEEIEQAKVLNRNDSKELIKRLFEMYIPEIASGVVEIIALAREAGNRTKIGIRSNNINVDAKGACVGLNGSRIKQINDALNGERIDIFEWKDNPVQLIAEALTPAKVISVLVNEEEKRSVVIVPDQQFSLAIGRGGQNARLASQTTGWKIDIKDETTAYREEIRFKPNVY